MAIKKSSIIPIIPSNLINKRKEITKERVVTIRLTESDFNRYEDESIKMHIKMAEYLRIAINEGVKKKLMQLKRKKS